MASTAAWSASSLSPRPTQRAAASAAASVTRTSSSARLRSGALVSRRSCAITLVSRLAIAGGYRELAERSGRAPNRPTARHLYRRCTDQHRERARESQVPTDVEADEAAVLADPVDQAVI